MQNFFKKHYLIIIIALFVGVLSSLPQYLATKNFSNFSGVYRGVTDDIIYYEARAQDIIDGHTYLTNPYLYEYKEGSPMQFWLPDYLLAKPVQYLGISVSVGFIIWTFVLTALLVFLSYSIIFVLTESMGWSVLGAIALHVSLFASKFLRIPSPGLNFVFWLTTLLFFILYIKNQENKNKHLWAILTSISFGLLFHIYPYYWTFYVVMFAIFIFLEISFSPIHLPRVFILSPGAPTPTRDLNWLNKISKYIYILFGGFIIGIPYFISLWKSSHLSTYSESLARLGLIHTHFPSGIDTVFWAGLVILLFAFCYWRKIIKMDTIIILLFSGTIATVIVTNQHIITGSNLEFSSHYFLGNAFWFFFSGLYLLYSWWKVQSEKIQKIVFLCLSALVFLGSCFSIHNLLLQETNYTEGDLYAQKYMPVFSWLNEHAKKDDVVYSNDEISYFISIYTSQNVFYNPFSILFFMSDVEAENRFILSHYFDTFDANYVLVRQRSIFGGYYVNEYGHNGSKNQIRKIFGLPPINFDLVPKSELDRIVIDAKQIQKISLIENLKNNKYKVDYIIWDSEKDSNWQISKLKNFKKVYEVNGLIVFEMVK